MHDGIYRESSERGEEEEVPTCVVELAECLLALCPSSRACRAEKQISFLCKQGSYSRTFAEHVSIVTDCHNISDLACKHCLVRAKFEWD